MRHASVDSVQMLGQVRVSQRQVQLIVVRSRTYLPLEQPGWARDFSRVVIALDVWIYVTKVGLKITVYLIKLLVLKPEPAFSLPSLIGRAGKGDLQGIIIALIKSVEIEQIEYLETGREPGLKSTVVTVWGALVLGFGIFEDISHRLQKGKYNEVNVYLSK